MLKVKNIHKSFGKHEVLKGIDLNVEKSDIIVILGPSGSGKTTLLKCINFLEKADEGSIDLDGIQVDCRHPLKKSVYEIRKQIGFVFQNYNLFQNKTALENVTEGLIVARRHIHMTSEDAKRLSVNDGETVKVKIHSDRPLIFDDVLIRVKDSFRLSMHIDFDEANACGYTSGVTGSIVKD